MAEDTTSQTLRGFAVPLYGNFEIVEMSGTEDIVTLTHKGGATGDFFVCRSSAGTEAFRVEDGGKVFGGSDLTVTAGDVSVAGRIKLASGKNFNVYCPGGTTAPSTGIVTGDFFPYHSGANTFNLAYCQESTATGNEIWKIVLSLNN